MAKSLELRIGMALATCTNHQAQIKMHEKLLERAVLRARAAGATWEQVGEALDMSQQGANARFGPIEAAKGPVAKPRVAKGQGSLAV
jgi:hypothetical protein